MSVEGDALREVLKRERELVERQAYGELWALNVEKHAALARYREMARELPTDDAGVFEALAEAREIEAYAHATLDIMMARVVELASAAKPRGSA